MASRLLAPSFRALAARPTTSAITSRAFQTSSRRMNEAAVAMPVRKPVGAFRGGMFGFLLGSSLAAYGTYYYILDEYRLSNEMLTEDIYIELIFRRERFFWRQTLGKELAMDIRSFYALQAAVQRIHNYVTALEEKVDVIEKKR